MDFGLFLVTNIWIVGMLLWLLLLLLLVLLLFFCCIENICLNKFILSFRIGFISTSHQPLLVRVSECLFLFFSLPLFRNPHWILFNIHVERMVARNLPSKSTTFSISLFISTIFFSIFFFTFSFSIFHVEYKSEKKNWPQHRLGLWTVCIRYVV